MIEFLVRQDIANRRMLANLFDLLTWVVIIVHVVLVKKGIIAFCDSWPLLAVEIVCLISWAIFHHQMRQWQCFLKSLGAKE